MPFPETIRSLPRTQLAEATVYVHDAPTTQVLFVEAPEDREVVVPTHRHGAEWGFVVQGEIVFEIDGKSERHPAGSQHWIPKDVPHSFRFAPGTMSVHFFVEKRVAVPGP